MVNPLKHLILINGLKRSGKDYATEIILKLLDNAGSVSYASPMKDIISKTFDISLADLDEYKNNSDYGIEIKFYPDNQTSTSIVYTDFRRILQRFGTEAMKPQFGDDVWALRGVESAIGLGKETVVISDFRFITEYETAARYAEKQGFKISTINIFNKNLPDADLHVSERNLDNNFIFDFYIDNTGHPDIEPLLSNILEKIKNEL